MEIFVSCKFFAHYFRAALYFLLPWGVHSLEAVPSLPDFITFLRHHIAQIENQ